MLADLSLISDDFPVVANKACVEVEDDVDEEEDVHDRVKDKHCHVCRVAGRPEQKFLRIASFFWLEYVISRKLFSLLVDCKVSRDNDNRVKSETKNHPVPRFLRRRFLIFLLVQV